MPDDRKQRSRRGSDPTGPGPISHRWQRAVDETGLDAMLPTARLRPGAMLGPYRIAVALARGGMATVWVGWRKRSNGKREIVALKTLHPHLAADPGFVRMFLDEARLLAEINHPNVVQIRDVGTDAGHAYAALEWVDGDSLTALLSALEARSEDMPLSLALRVVGECCLGLHVAHELCTVGGESLGVVHRDVSMSNVLLSAAGDVKLIDFGVAKAKQRLGDKTRVGVIKGKASYIAPEQIDGRSVDRRVDVWAAGVILYRLVAGRLPFEGTMFETIDQIKRGAALAPLPPGTPPPIAEVVQQALARDPDHRFESAADMRRAIQYAAADVCEPVTRDEFGAFVEQELASRLIPRRVEIARALSRRFAT